LAVNVSEWGYNQMCHVGAKSFGLSYEDARDKYDLRLKIKGATS